ncbi:MAG TPA: hypothetical protein DCO86_04005 [Spirochaetaceae bacterium]|nr:hypothetical protein [Spirochaetaceae bacterium]
MGVFKKASLCSDFPKALKHCKAFRLAIFAIAGILCASCISNVVVEVKSSELVVVTRNEYMPSVSDFQDSLESVLGSEIDLEKEKYGFFSFDTNELESLSKNSRLSEIIKTNRAPSSNLTPSNPEDEAGINSKKYEFHIDADNYENLEEVFPVIGNDKVKTYLADYNRDMSEEEYLEMIDFVFGDNSSKDLQKSTVTILFISDNGFSSHNGLEVENDNTLRLDLRLLDFLLLKTPIAFSFECAI